MNGEQRHVKTDFNFEHRARERRVHSYRVARTGTNSTCLRGANNFKFVFRVPLRVSVCPGRVRIWGHDIVCGSGNGREREETAHEPFSVAIYLLKGFLPFSTIAKREQAENTKKRTSKTKETKREKEEEESELHENEQLTCN